MKDTVENSYFKIKESAPALLKIFLEESFSDFAEINNQYINLLIDASETCDNLVPVKFWTFFDKKYKYITKNKDGRILIHEKLPSLYPSVESTAWYSRSDYITLYGYNFEDCLIETIDWKKALGCRP